MSDIINLLPDAVANQIAAGEVVQRPASAIKELMENAIDAGADKIQLVVNNAGKTLIQVIDNGCGMSVTDARLCFERHATSKIKLAEDLFAIRTMGFRGEAMASIAAIAQVELRTRRHEDELGTIIEVEGSHVVKQEPIAISAGTNICVKNLFYNIPARRNFLKSNAVEMRHIIEEFQRLALAHPEIFFSLHSDNNELFHLPAAGLKQRIIHLFGNTYNQRLVPVEEETTIIKLKGFIGKPEFGKKTRGEQYFFVNNRYIRDPYLNHAVMGAYSELLPTDTYPLYVLFIDIDPSKIDINVHPTKTEIKYQDDRSIYAIIRSAVKRSLGRYNITPSLDFDQENGFSQMVTPKPLDEIVPPSITFNPDFNPFDTDTKKSPSYGGSTASVPRERTSAMNQNWESLYEMSEKTSFTQLLIPTLETVNDELKQTSGKAIFQLHNRFIVSQIRSGFMLIDQQAAHERVLFERFSQQLEDQKGASQQSLFPQTINLNSGDFELIQDLLPDIQALGFLIRPFGKNAFVIDGIPADLTSSLGASQVLEQLLENFKNNQQVNRLSKRENLAQSLARSTAIKAGTALSEEEMADLIDKLFACESPNVSLSSKNVIITFTLKELLEKFGK
ncbi:MAG TPA: DNA mismatch repair endonuclease MutL [Sphingobacteriaceae bacterium]|nr:DNA mismatch repair endonuclease MutL [Sphingobacteriaceae bacterium]